MGTRTPTGRFRTLGFYFLPAALAAAQGCTAQVYSPPSRMPSLESVATLGEGKVAVAGRGGAHAEVFGPGLAFGAGKVRYGVSEHTDAYAEGSLLVVTNDTGSQVENPSRVGGALQLGVKHELAKWFAVHGGLGGGLHAFGGFVAPEVGAVVAYENPYFVPFFDVTLSASAPLGGRSRILRFDSDEKTREERHEARFTGYLAGTAGFRIPIAFPEGSGIAGVDLLGGLTLTYAAARGSRTANLTPTGEDAVDGYGTSSGFIGLAGGAEVRF